MYFCRATLAHLVGTVLISLVGLVMTGCFGTAAATTSMPGGDVARGELLLRDYGCHACHVIPGVAGANALVGPPLTAWAKRHYIAGSLTNTPENLIEWLQYPQRVEPGTAMPDLGVTEQDARDMGAYLYTLTADE